MSAPKECVSVTNISKSHQILTPSCTGVCKHMHTHTRTNTHTRTQRLREPGREAGPNVHN